MNEIKCPQQIDFPCGFVRLIDVMPGKYDSEKLKCDEAIVRAARVSYNRESKGEEADVKLIKFLMKHNHGTPTESVVFKLMIKCPIFVQRHIVKHRMTSMNEVSARYTTVKDGWYTPEVFRCQSKSNRQASDGFLNEKENEEIKNEFETKMKEIYGFYNELLEKGVSREQARTILPQCMYTTFYLTLNLRSLLNLIYLRNSSFAQSETREVAVALEEILKITNPISYETYRESNPIT